MARIAGPIAVLGANVERLAGHDIAAQVMAGSEQLSDSSKPGVVARWVQEAMARLDTLVEPAVREQIMIGCGRNCASVNGRVIERARTRRRKYASTDDFLAAEQKKPTAGTRLVLEGSVLHQFYTPHAFTHPMRCYCGLLRGLPDGETCSLTYCHCSRGFVQTYWERVLERPVSVELVSSSIAGAEECEFRIRL